MKRTTRKLIKKVKGIYFNHNGIYNKNYINTAITIFRKLNIASMSILQQSIHHIDFLSNDNGYIENIQISFREMGIKPEDIDGILLEKKKEKEGLTSYEQLLYGMWLCHHDSKRTKEYKLIKQIARELLKLKSKWTDTKYISFNNLNEEQEEELLNDAKNIITNITKYEML